MALYRILAGRTLSAVRKQPETNLWVLTPYSVQVSAKDLLLFVDKYTVEGTTIGEQSRQMGIFLFGDRHIRWWMDYCYLVTKEPE